MVPASPKHASTHTSQVVNAKYTLVYLTILSSREKQILSKKKMVPISINEHLFFNFTLDITMITKHFACLDKVGSKRVDKNMYLLYIKKK